MTTLAIQKVGNQSRAIALLHGWGFDSQVWLKVVPALTEYFSVYLIDLPGFGGSDVMDWETFQRLCCAQLPSDVMVVGWSLGGLYAMRLAIEQPQQISQLVGVGATPRFIEDIAWPGEKTTVFDHFIARVLANPEETLNDFLQLQAKKRVPFVLKKPLNIVGLEASLVMLKNWDLRHPLQQVKKGHFIFGRLDSIVTVKTCEVMREAYPWFGYTIFSQAAHAPFLSHTDQFVEVLKQIAVQGNLP